MMDAPTGLLSRLPPPAALADSVEFMSQRKVDVAPLALQVFATARAEIVFHFGDPFGAGPGPHAIQPLPRAAVLAPRAVPYWQTAGPRIDWFLVALTAVGCRTLLGVPMAVLWDRDRPLSDFVGERTEALHTALAAADSLPERMALFAEAMGPRASSAPSHSVAWAADAARTGDVRTISAMCDMLGIGPRRLRQKFATEIGLAPKPFLSILRFGRHLQAIHPGPWRQDENATAAEYADDSHAHRAFRRFAGTTPGRYRQAKSAAADRLVFTAPPVPLQPGGG